MTLLVSVATLPCRADGITIAGGAAADAEGSRSLSGLVDMGFGDINALTLIAGAARGDTVTDRIDTRSAALTWTQTYDAGGWYVSGGLWGDADRLESADYTLGVFASPGGWRFGLDYERREIDLTFSIAPLIGGNPPRQVTVGASASGYGASVRYEWPSRTRVRLSGRRFDYDRNLNQLARLDAVRRISPTTLTLAGALRDFTVTASAEFEAGLSVFGIDVTRDRLAIGAIDVTGVTGRWLTPVGRRTDLELSVGYSDSADGDGAASVGLLLFYYLD
ncbi:MAG: hypothetical protein AAFX58_00940 [Pseudomonadota bacterium]